MTFEEFNKLDEKEKEVTFSVINADAEKLKDVEAERDSFKAENDNLKKDNDTLSDDLKKTKELNFTLGRRLDVSKKRESAEDILHNMFNKRGE